MQLPSNPSSASSHPRSNHPAGFSLVEMLVVITIIGVIASIAVPGLSDLTGSSEIQTARRNAQQICSVHAAAVAAGADFNGTTKLQVTDELIAGVTARYLNDHEFVIPMSDEARDAALAYVSMVDNRLQFYPDGLDEAPEAPIAPRTFVTRFNNEAEAIFRAAEFQMNAPPGRTYVVVEESGSHPWSVYYEEE